MSGGFKNREDTGLVLTASEALLLQTLDAGVLNLTETTAPSATSGIGKVYVKASDSKLYYKNDSGTEFDLAATGSGTVTSVAALTLGTTGTDLSSTVADGTTTPVITLQVPTASATNRGALSATDWSTFNAKGSGTVTAVSVATANGVSGSSSGGATPALTIALGAITPSTVNALTLASQAVGFTVAGGTTSKTLTVPLDASVSGTNTGDNAANSTANTYADGKVADAINDGTTTVAPSQNAVFDALALKAPIASPTFTGVAKIPSVSVGFTTTATAGGLTTLISTSTTYQVFTGTENQSVQLPDARTLTTGHRFMIDNDSTQTITIKDGGANDIWVLAPGTDYYVTCSGIATAAGTWVKDYSAAKAATGKALTITDTASISGTNTGDNAANSTSANLALSNLASVAMNAPLQWNNSAATSLDIATTANTVVGRELTIGAGSTTTGGTADMAGGNLILNSGLGKGTGASDIVLSTGRTLTTGSTLQTLTEAMRIKGNGNVGIGTTGPDEKFTIQDGRYHVLSSSILSSFTTLNPTHSVAILGASAPGNLNSNDRDTWLYKDPYTAANFGIYFRNIQSADNGLPADSVGFIGGGVLKAYIGLDGNGYFSGNVGIGTTGPTAYLHLTAGTATASTAPIKLTAGTVNTTPEAGAIEFDGTDYWFTI